jgi:pimeloyl-ACP methyl ester carboxylesterase
MGMIKGLSIIFSIFVSLMLIASPFGIVSLQFASAQASQVSSDVNNNNNNNNANSLNVQDIPLQKVHVGDIDVGYKVFGKGEPFLLIGGIGSKMDSWDSSILRNLSTNHTVIVFDNRGVGNTTAGTKPFSVQQFANDTAGLLEALKIPKANVMGHSLGSYIAQQLAVTHPEKINRLLLVAAACGGNQSILPNLQDIRRADEILNSLTNNIISITRQDAIMFMNTSEGSAWLKSHPELLQGIPERQNLTVSEFTGGIPLNTYKKYPAAAQAWMSTNWSGVCDELTRISSPTLVITGTDDNAVIPANSLIIAGKIPGAWLVHIKDAGHVVMDQYPVEFSKILNTFLTTTTAQASNATSTATAAAAAGTNTTTTTTTTNTNTTTAQPTMNSTSTPSEAG